MYLGGCEKGLSERVVITVTTNDPFSEITDVRRKPVSRWEERTENH